MQYYWWLIIGIFIGWITKIPLLLKYYREMQSIKDMVNRHVEYLERKEKEKIKII